MSGPNGIADAIVNRTDEQIKSDLAERADTIFDLLIRLRDHAREQSLGLKGLAMQTGIPQGTLSSLFTGKYTGDWDNQAERLNKFFHDLEMKRIFGGCRDFVETKLAKCLWKVYDKTRYNRRIQIIQSPEQLGKSRAARTYTKNNNGGRTIMVTLQPGGPNNGFALFLRDLAAALGYSTDHKKLIELRQQIKSRLQVCDLMILDEWHMLNTWGDLAIRAMLDYLRIDLHADGERGIILQATNDDVLNKLDAFRRRSRYNVGQLLGRMTSRRVLELHPDEIPIEDVKMLVERYFKPRSSTITKLHNLAIRPRLGHLGLIDAILADAWADAQLEKENLDDDRVLAVAQETLEDLETRKDLYKEIA